MSQTICANCGKPHAPQVTTNQVPGEAKWPTYGADILYMLKKMKMEELREKLAKGEPVTINGQRMGVPPIPSLIQSNEPVTVNERRTGVPDLPSLVPLKEAA